MAKLDRPLLGTQATGILARSLAFRMTLNPPDEPGETAISMGTVAGLPRSACPPSSAQALQRARYVAAVAAWNALSDGVRGTYSANKPVGLSGFNFFVRSFLSPSLTYLGYCVFGAAWFQLSTSPDQPVKTEYDKYFPAGADEFPVLVDGAHSPQAWFLTSLFNTLLTVENYLLSCRASIEA